MADAEGKKLTELRVIDLKTELERRGLDKTGNKAALLERLAKAIKEDGENPDEYLIVPCGGASKLVPTKKPTDTQSIVEEVLLEPEPQIEDCKSNSNDDNEKSVPNEEPEVNPHFEIENENNIDEPELSINAHPDDDLELDYGHDDPDPDPEPEEEPMEEEPMEEDEPQQEEAAPETKQFLHSEESSNVSAVETNGIDNEDSINLTIGEDEENLLGEETESNDRLKDGGKKRTEETDSNSNASTISKKGDSKGSGKVESGASSNKEGTSGSSAAGVKNKDGDGSKSADLASKGSKKDDKDKPTSSSTSTSRNLWVSGLSSTTRATDLKQIFSKYGKVIGAKVVTNARTPGARCYGYVTMSTSDDAEKCIEFLHRTELHGRVISVEKAKGDAQPNHTRKPAPKTDNKDEKEKEKSKETEEAETEPIEKTEEKAKIEEVAKDEEEKKEEEEGNGDSQDGENSAENKDEGSLKDCETRSNKSSSKKSDRDRPSSREDKKRSWDRTRVSRSKSRERPPRRDNVLSFDKIKEERERQRLREKERLMREEKRRRREDVERQRAIDREAARLEREREKLKIEREKIEQEKAELLRLERERQKAEREKLERERERIEMKKQQLRLDDSRPRGGGHPSAIKRPSSDRREGRDAYGEPERKRIAPEHPSRRHSPPERVERRTDVMDRISDRRMESSGNVPSRYDGRSKDMGGMQKPPFKRVGDFRNNRDDQYHSSVRGGRDSGMVRRDTRPNPNSIVHRPVKERYDSRPTGGFTRDREVHRSDDHRGAPRDNRYEGSKPNPRDNRYMDNSRPTGWQSGPPSSKPFHSVNSREQQSGWNSRPSDSSKPSRGGGNRWNNSNNMGGHQRSQVYQGGSQHQSYGMSQGGGSYERFDQYKGSMQNMRKY